MEYFLILLGIWEDSSLFFPRAMKYVTHMSTWVRNRTTHQGIPVRLEQSNVWEILKMVLGHLSSSVMLEHAKETKELFLKIWNS